MYFVLFALYTLFATSHINNSRKNTSSFAFSDKRILYNQKVFVILRAIVDCKLELAELDELCE
jgi:hypothetical protein